MKINFKKSNGQLKVIVDGRLDTTTAPELAKFLEAYEGKIESLIIDCHKMTYVSSAGLRVLLATHKKMNGSMKLTKVGDVVMEVFEMTGFADVLVIEREKL